MLAKLTRPKRLLRSHKQVFARPPSLGSHLADTYGRPALDSKGWRRYRPWSCVLITASLMLSCSFPARRLFATTDPAGHSTDRRDVTRTNPNDNKQRRMRLRLFEGCLSRSVSVCPRLNIRENQQHTFWFGLGKQKSTPKNEILSGSRK